jgi:hypothetical protein
VTTPPRALLQLLHDRSKLPELVPHVRRLVVRHVEVAVDVLAAVALHELPKVAGWNCSVIDHGPVRGEATLLRAQHPGHEQPDYVENLVVLVCWLRLEPPADLGDRLMPRGNLLRLHRDCAPVDLLEVVAVGLRADEHPERLRHEVE